MDELLPADGRPLVDDVEHGRACHERWLQKTRYDEREERRSPGSGQCMFCRYYIPVVRVLMEDWGVCSHAASPFDGHVMFEHDGCEHYSPADDMWQWNPAQDREHS